MTIPGRALHFMAALIALLAVLSSPGMAQTIKGPVRVCDDISEWPPYIYYEREGPHTEQLVGLSIDVLKHILQKQGLALEISLLPWKVCLEQVEKGRRDIVMNATGTPTFVSRFLLTRAYYRTTPSYIYSTRRYPQGLAVESKTDLRQYKGCGVRGRDYSRYHIPAGKLDTASADINAAVRKLLEGRCDYMPISFEPFAAYSLTGNTIPTNPILGHAPIPGMPKLEHHMLLSKTVRGQRLKEIIDQGIEELFRSGRMFKLRDNYGLQ